MEAIAAYTMVSGLTFNGFFFVHIIMVQRVNDALKAYAKNRDSIEASAYLLKSLKNVRLTNVPSRLTNHAELAKAILNFRARRTKGAADKVLNALNKVPKLNNKAVNAPPRASNVKLVGMRNFRNRSMNREQYTENYLRHHEPSVNKVRADFRGFIKTAPRANIVKLLRKRYSNVELIALRNLKNTDNEVKGIVQEAINKSPISGTFLGLLNGTSFTYDPPNTNSAFGVAMRQFERTLTNQNKNRNQQ
jgi:hypothetical protein